MNRISQVDFRRKVKRESNQQNLRKKDEFQVSTATKQLKAN